MNTQDPKYQQKSKAISSAEPNYLSQFEMRYPVMQLTPLTHIVVKNCLIENRLSRNDIYGGPRVKLHNTLTVFGCKRNIMIQELAKLHDHMCESVIRIVRIWMIFLRNPSGIWK